MILRKRLNTAVKILRRALGYGLLAAVVSIVSIAIYMEGQGPDPELWHEVDLDEEFTEDLRLSSFKEYLALEDRLFQQLESEVYQKTAPGDSQTIHRYQKGSLTDPTSQNRQWNRTFEMTHKNPEAGVLLLHGLTDSPYSMRSLAQSFYDSGASIIALRLPGHGTAPSGLVEVSWQDMAAAVRLATSHLKKSIGEKPLYIAGYSNGAALAVRYTLESMEAHSLPRPEALVLLSPEIGVSKVAKFAIWQGRLGHWLGVEKLAWNSIHTEYDPFKYNSFAVNAGDLAYRLTNEIDEHIKRLSKRGDLANFPAVLAFQSVVDATVSTSAIVSRLFDRLPRNGHELVLFDINHQSLTGHLLKKNHRHELEQIVGKANEQFALSILSNKVQRKSATSSIDKIHIRRREAGGEYFEVEKTTMSWPEDVFSLSHIALPFPQNDPIYGAGDDGKIPTLGNRALRGERDILSIGSGEMLRQRWNPFLPWLKEKALRFTSLGRNEIAKESKKIPDMEEVDDELLE